MSHPSDEVVFSTRIKAELSTVPDIDGWPELSGRMQTAPRRRLRWLPGRRPVRSRRLMAGLVAGVLIALIGAASTVAANGTLSEWMRSVGLGAAATPQQVSASATYAGITIKATEAYRDSYTIALTIQIDDPATNGAAEQHYLLGPAPPTMVTSAGTMLQLSTNRSHGMGNPGQSLLVFTDPAFGQIKGDAVTLTIPSLVRWAERDPKQKGTDISGPWTLQLDLHGSSTPLRQLPAPTAGQVGPVKVTYHDVTVSGTYLALHLDLTELAPNAVASPPSEESRGVITHFDLEGPDGKRLEQVAWVFDDPGKGEIKQSATPKTYHWGYLYSVRPGTYKLVVRRQQERPGKEPAVETMERTLHVG